MMVVFYNIYYFHIYYYEKKQAIKQARTHICNIYLFIYNDILYICMYSTIYIREMKENK